MTPGDVACALWGAVVVGKAVYMLRAVVAHFVRLRVQL
jgi:hypothetical protein